MEARQFSPTDVEAPPPRAKIARVHEHLAEHFPHVRILVRDFGEGQPIAFLLRWRDQRDARVRISLDRLCDRDAADEILPAEALHALELGQSILVTHDAIQIESRVE